MEEQCKQCGNWAHFKDGDNKDANLSNSALTPGSVTNKDYDTLISLCRTIVRRYNKEHCAINPPIESLGKLLKRFENK